MSDEQSKFPGFDRVIPPPIVGWAEGRQIAGEFLGMREGKFGNLLDIMVENPDTLQRTKKTLGAPTILASILSNIPDHTDIIIYCKGKIDTAGGQAWDFEVYKKKDDQTALPF